MKTLLIALVVILLVSCGNDIGDMEPVRVEVSYLKDTIWWNDSTYSTNHTIYRYYYSDADNERLIGAMNIDTGYTYIGDIDMNDSAAAVVDRTVTLPNPIKKRNKTN